MRSARALIRQRHVLPLIGECWSRLAAQRGRYALPVDQRLKLLGDPDVELHDALIPFTLAAILASDRKHAVFLGMVENREQLALGIDQHGEGSVLWKRRSRRNCSMPQLGCHFGGCSPLSIQRIALSVFRGSGCSQAMHWRVRCPLPLGGSAKVRLAPHLGQVSRAGCPMAANLPIERRSVHSK